MTANTSDSVISTRTPEQVQPNFRALGADLIVIGFEIGKLGFVEQQEKLNAIAAELRSAPVSTNNYSARLSALQQVVADFLQGEFDAGRITRKDRR